MSLPRYEPSDADRGDGPLEPAAPISAAHGRAAPSFWERAKLPLILFVLTCWTTNFAGRRFAGSGPLYSIPLMTILLCHEFGHYLQALRYRVPATLPYFIPMVPPLGTMGAVIAMGGNMGNRKSLFDIGITGPLAGLVPATIFSIAGLLQSDFIEVPASGGLRLGEPLFFTFLANWVLGPAPPHQELYLHSMAYAGWVGIFITALNLIPIGQLDGGHILYALLRRKAHIVATMLLLAAIVGVVITQNYSWLLMLMLLTLVGPNHPPTGDDEMPLGIGRTILGWLTLGFVIIGFTPTPFMM
jgi:membrane-associated protease RseP (regulator of RpoE activity)